MKISQETFQRCFNVFFWLIWHRNVEQCQINVETTFFISKSEYTALSEINSMTCVSTLIWTTLDNVKITFLFSTSSFATFINFQTTLWKPPFSKWAKRITSNWIHWIQIFNCYLIIFFTLPFILQGTCWRIFAKIQ